MTVLGSIFSPGPKGLSMMLWVFSVNKFPYAPEMTVLTTTHSYSASMKTLHQIHKRLQLEVGPVCQNETTKRSSEFSPIQCGLLNLSDTIANGFPKSVISAMLTPSPVSQRLTSSWQVHAPLMHVQGDRSEACTRLTRRSGAR